LDQVHIIHSSSSFMQQVVVCRLLTLYRLVVRVAPLALAARTRRGSCGRTLLGAQVAWLLRWHFFLANPPKLEHGNLGIDLRVLLGFRGGPAPLRVLLGLAASLEGFAWTFLAGWDTMSPIPARMAPATRDRGRKPPPPRP